MACFRWSWGCPCAAGPAWDRDRQTRSDQRVSTVIRRAGATTTGKKCPTGTTLDDLGNRLRPGRSPSEHRSCRDDTSQPKRVMGTRAAWARTPARHTRLGPSPGLGAGSGPACRTRFGRAPPTTPPRPSGYTPLAAGPRPWTLRVRAAEALGTRPRLVRDPPWKASHRPDEGLARFAPNTEWGPTKRAPSTTSGARAVARATGAGSSAAWWTPTAFSGLVREELESLVDELLVELEDSAVAGVRVDHQLVVRQTSGYVEGVRRRQHPVVIAVREEYGLADE